MNPKYSFIEGKVVALFKDDLVELSAKSDWLLTLLKTIIQF